MNPIPSTNPQFKKRNYLLVLGYLLILAFELSLILFMRTCDVFLFSEYTSCHLLSASPVRCYG